MAVLLAVLASTLAVAVPAVAQETPGAQGSGGAQYQAGQSSPEVASVTGEVVERGGYFYVVDGATGKEYVLDGAGSLFAPFEGEVATVYGAAECTVAICSLEVEGVRGLEEEATIVGKVVEIGGWRHLVDEATGTEYHLVGSVEEAEALTGQRVEASGVTQCFTDGPSYGCTLAFSTIEPIEEGTTGGEAQSEASGGQAGANADGTAGSAPAQDEAAGSASDRGSLLATGSEGGNLSSAVESLPSTGGVLPIAGATGLLILVASLIIRKQLA